MPGTTKSVVVVRPQQMETWEFPLPDVGPRDLLLRVEMVGICGSEPKKYLGTSVWNPPYPVILFPLEDAEKGMKLFMSGDPDCIRVALRP